VSALISSIALCLLVSTASVASAQDHDARAHFRRGLEHFNEGNYDAALAEFERAYEIDPAHQVLYNIARVHAAQGNAVEATAGYERYLEEGGTQIAADRRREVERALEVQRARIGQLDVQVSVDGATIAVDGNDVATSPLEAPLEVTAGTVELEIRAANHEAVRRTLRVAGGAVERLVIELVEAVRPGILRIESAIPDVVVEIDGEAVGHTPFDSTVTLTVGQHRLVARRAGYRAFERTLQIDRGSEAEVTLEMERDEFAGESDVGRLALTLPDAPYQARIDGEAVSHGALGMLPVGRHRLELDIEDRLPYAEVIDIRGGETTDLSPSLEWTPSVREDLTDGASLRRWTGVGLTVGGVALAGAGLSLALWNSAEITETNRLIVENNVIVNMACRPPGIDPAVCRPAEARSLELNAQRDDQAVLEVVSWTVFGVGAASTVIGLFLWLTAPSEEQIDEDAHATIDLIPLEGGALLTTRMPLTL